MQDEHINAYIMDIKYLVFLFVEVIGCIYAQDSCGG